MIKKRIYVERNKRVERYFKACSVQKRENNISSLWGRILVGSLIYLEVKKKIVARQFELQNGAASGGSTHSMYFFSAPC